MNKELISASIRKWTLKNAIEHKGKSVVGAIIPKILGEFPDAKDNLKEITTMIKQIVGEVNSKEMNSQIQELNNIAPEMLEKKKEEKSGIPELEDAEDGNIVMMFPPEPSKYATIGHAKACLLNYLACKKHNGKFMIRFEDTNAKKISEEYYEKMLEDLKWLGVEWERVDYISSHLEEMYDIAKKFIEKEKAYMCNCPADKSSKLRKECKPCDCREKGRDENLELWKKMMEGDYKEGQYSLRAKIDMKHKNAALRDPTIMRILSEPHPRTKEKYFVWPVYDFATSVMDGIEKITHRIRSKEFELKAELQEWIQKQAEIKPPVIIEFARFNLQGIPASGRIIREKMASKELMGWDDPRIPTLISLRKRGFLPESIRNFVVATGLSKTESTVMWEVLEAENRKLIEPVSDRYFFVKDILELEVNNIPDNFSAERNLHPDLPKRGKVKYVFSGNEKFYVDKKDFRGFESGITIRLMDLMNIQIKSITPEKITAEFGGTNHVKGNKIIHWVSEKENIPVKILMANGETWEGIGEKSMEKIKEGSFVQFIRTGYSILEKINKELFFRFTHR